MLNKQQHIDYWKKTAADDWKAVQVLLKGGRNVQALFFAHLVIEKLLKAHWVKNNTSNYPPKIHNLVYLHSKTNLNLTIEQISFLEQMNTFQLEGRYPDYVADMGKIYKANITHQIINTVNQIKKCLLKNL